MTVFMTIDGSRGEGGGQILRTALSLAIVTDTPVHLERIRAGRKKSGLLRQHLTAVNAARAICDAEVEGATLRSQELWFRPRALRGGEYRFTVGTAGSASLVFQTVLPALWHASAPSRVVFEGGTHNPMAPPVDFIERSFLPLVARLGAHARVTLQQHGFYPAGGGRFVAEIQPWAERNPLTLVERGPVVQRRARALVAQLRRDIATRELRVVRERLGWDARECAVENIEKSHGPGNVLLCELGYREVTQVVCGFGQKGVPAETVAERAVAEILRLERSGAPVCEHLADQLMLPLALGAGGRYLTTEASLHARTNLDIIRMFLDVDAQFVARDGTTEIHIERR